MAKKTDVKPEKAKSDSKPTPSPKAPNPTHGTTPRIPALPGSLVADPALLVFAEGLTAIEKKDWAAAAERFGRVIVESDLPDLTARARQYKAMADKRLPAAAADTEEDPYLQAVVEKNRGNYKSALEIAKKGGRDKKDERFAYLAAAIHAIENRTEEATQALSQAVELNPKNRIHAFHDTDFAELKKNRDHRHLFGLT